MIVINMFSSANKVAGQGVGAVYTELMGLLKHDFSNEFEVNVNRYTRSDISHYHTIDPKFYLSTFSKKRGRKIGFVHFVPSTLDASLKLPRVARWTLDKYTLAFYKRMDQLVVVNPNFIPKLEAYGISRDKVTYIPNFVSQRTFHPVSTEKRQALRHANGFKPDDFVIFGAGQVQDRKGVSDFIKLAKQNPEFRFVWAGGFSFGRITEGYDHLKKAVAEALANLDFTGIMPRETMIDYYNMADVFLLPSYEELFPMSVLEAFATGTPVMVRDLELYHQIITPYAITAVDVDDMQSRLRALADDHDLLATYATKSRQAAEVYDESRLEKVWHDFYLHQAARGKH